MNTVDTDIKEAIKTGKRYEVVYADPPWYYNNARKSGFHPSKHYDGELKYEQLSVLPIQQISQPNAILFLWSTNSHLDEAIYLIRDWGFKYKTNLIWDKKKRNHWGGKWHLAQHEVLLIAENKKHNGTPLPKPSSPRRTEDLRIPSIYSERSKKHSAKPQFIRNWIDKLWSTGSRIELFAIDSSVGWDTIGNQKGHKKYILDVFLREVET